VLFGPGPTLCGHRGSGRGIVDGQRENTLGSFRAAVEAGLPWVEADARFTADDVLVSRHDPVADDGRFISEITAEEADAQGLMRLADLLEDLPEEIGVDVDIKTSLEDALRPRERTTAALVADLIAERAGTRTVLASSFDPAAIMIVRERAPEVPIGLLTWMRFPLRKSIAAAAQLGCEVVAPQVASFGLREGAPLERDRGEFVAVAHQAGLQVVAWCPTPPEAETLIDAGVDCVILDDVPDAVATLTACSPTLRGRRRLAN
jgi:glycerophosphoryl diester phosphodiesterase